MTTLKILIVEDQLLTAKRVKQQLEKQGYSVCGMLSRGEEVESFTIKHAPDIVLMDIKLAGKMDGIRVAEQLQKTHPVPLIFLTDLNDAATMRRAHKARPASYLVKPFTERQLHASITMALHNASTNREAKPGEQVQDDKQPILMQGKIFIKGKHGFYKMNTTDIVCLKASRSYCEVYMKDGTSTVLTMDMGTFYRNIAFPALMQVHRSWIVNMHEVERIVGNTLIIGKLEIPIAKEDQEKVLRLFPIIK